MKRSFLSLFLLLVVWHLSAVPVTVSGYVTYTNGNAAAGSNLFIGSVDPNIPANLAVTDANGFYSLVVDLPATDSVVMVQVLDSCTANFTLAPIINGAATADFVLCSGFNNPNCWVYAYYQRGANLSAQFFGEGYGTDSTATFTYAWAFGDGATSTEQNPTHTYANPGTYTVTLTVNSGDCSSTYTLWIQIYATQAVTVTGHVTDQNDAPVPLWFVYLDNGDPSAPTYGYTDDQGFYSILAYLPETATSVTTYTWDFCTPNGLTGTAPIVNGAAQIDFQICFDSFPPPPDCQAYLTYAQLDSLTFQFTAYSYTKDSTVVPSYLWDFGDGSTSTEQNPVHTYAQDGVYSVLLTVTADSNCVAHACEIICTYGGGTVDTFYYGCQAMFTAGWGGNDSTSYDPLTLSFYDLSFGVVKSWVWHFGDGASDTVQNPVHTYAASGLYLVTLSIETMDGCQSTIAMEVYAGDNFPGTEYGCQAMFLPLPDSTGNGFFFLDLSYAPAPIQSWQWNFGDGTTSNEQFPYHAYTTPGVYTISLTITADSCNSVISFELDTNNPFNGFRSDGAVLGASANSTGTKAPPAVDGLKVFPNPAVFIFNVAFSSRKAQDLELRLYDMSGQLLRSQINTVAAGPSAVQVSAQDLAPGFYTLQMRSAEGVQSVKVVKQ